MGIISSQRRRTSKGFTIVELLIVVVVIAVLASIVIVSYNGVRSKAQESVVSSEASQVTKKLAAFAIEANESYPTPTQFYNSMGFLDSDLARYRYTPSSNNTAFCLTVTKDTTSYYASSTNMIPTKGRCTEHATTTITNLVTNPSNETAATGYNSSGATGGTGRDTAAAMSGTASARTLYSASGSGGQYYGSSTPTRPSVTAGQTYTASFYSMTNMSTSVTITPRLVWYNSGATVISQSTGDSFTVDNSKWRRGIITATAPATATNVAIYFQSDAVAWANGNRQYTDGLMLTLGSEVYPYADGDSAGWSWSGTAHASTSSGPSL